MIALENMLRIPGLDWSYKQAGLDFNGARKTEGGPDIMIQDYEKHRSGGESQTFFSAIKKEVGICVR